MLPKSLVVVYNAAKQKESNRTVVYNTVIRGIVEALGPPGRGGGALRFDDAAPPRQFLAGRRVLITAGHGSRQRQAVTVFSNLGPSLKLQTRPSHCCAW